MKLHPQVAAVTQRIRERSAAGRTAYLQAVEAAASRPRGDDRMGCANVAHAFAALPGSDKFRVVAEHGPNIGIVTAYNDMLSAHAPYAHFPDVIKDEARRNGATAQVTCTFYGTANSNQMLLEAMGLHVPGAAFVNPQDGLRELLTREAVRSALAITKQRRFAPIGRLVDERAIVNAMAALLATGGST